MQPLFTNGTEFKSPTGAGYRLTRDVFGGDPIMAGDFEAFGGAAEPEGGKMMPAWLFRQTRGSE